MVPPKITRREVGGFGKVSGNIYANDRVGIRSQGSLTGDVTAQRISVGAFSRATSASANQGEKKVGWWSPAEGGRGPITCALVGK
jgi:hypothetical protein